MASGKPSWTTTKKQIHAYYSAMDGSIQPYGITLPANYDPSKPTRLYVWLHGRQNQTTESEFLTAFPKAGPGKVPREIGYRSMEVYQSASDPEQTY